MARALVDEAVRDEAAQRAEAAAPAREGYPTAAESASTADSAAVAQVQCLIWVLEKRIAFLDEYRNC